MGIPVNIPALDGNEGKYLQECIKTGWISSEGPFVKKFEEGFSSYVGQKYGIAVTNGTVALDLAIQALGLGKGDEVIIPSFTIISCVSSVVLAGATPVVVDCDPITWNMDVSKIEAAITSKTKAIMPVHIYGLPVDMDPLLEIARKNGVAVIEDAAEAHGLTYKGRQCGSMGDIATFSFYPNKHITTGEGGMVMTSREDLYENVISIRNLCFQPHQRFVHERLGTNARMTNMQAALGVAQLERIEKVINRKRQIGDKYNDLFLGLDCVQLPTKKTEYADNIYWVYGMVLNDDHPMDAEAAIKALGKKGIGTRPFFFPMHEQPVFKRMGLLKDAHCPVSERIARRGFYIPSGLGLTDQQIHEVAEAVIEVLK